MGDSISRKSSNVPQTLLGARSFRVGEPHFAGSDNVELLLELVKYRVLHSDEDDPDVVGVRGHGVVAVHHPLGVVVDLFSQTVQYFQFQFFISIHTEQYNLYCFSSHLCH